MAFFDSLYFTRKQLKTDRTMKPHDNKHLESQLRQLSEVFTLISRSMEVLDEQFAPYYPRWVFSGDNDRFIPYIVERLRAVGADSEQCLYLLGLLVEILTKEGTDYLDKKWGFGGHFKLMYLTEKMLSRFIPGLVTKKCEVFGCVICTEGRLKRGDRLGDWEVVKVSEDGKEATIAWKGDLTKTIPIALSFIDDEKRWVWVYNDFATGTETKKWDNIETHNKSHLGEYLLQLSMVFAMTNKALHILDKHFIPSNPQGWLLRLNDGQVFDSIFEGFLDLGADSERAMYLTRLFIETLLLEAHDYLNKRWGFGEYITLMYLSNTALPKLFPETADVDGFICAIHRESRLKRGDMLGEWKVIQVSEDGEKATITWKRDRTQTITIRKLFFDELEQKWVWFIDDEVIRVSKFDNSLDIFRMN